LFIWLAIAKFMGFQMTYEKQAYFAGVPNGFGVLRFPLDRTQAILDFCRLEMDADCAEFEVTS
jgi:hypothetical protein